MTLANGIFAQVLDYLLKVKMVKDQHELAAVTGITETTISRILNDKVRQPSRDTWQKLNEAFGNIFNPQYFRGESTIMLLEDIRPETNTQPTVDPSSYINALIAEHTAYVNRLNDDLKKKEIEMQERLAEKDARIVELKNTIADKDTIIKDREARIVALERKLSAYATSDLDNYPFSVGVADDGDCPRKNV